MADITTLKRSISNMTDHEIDALIQDRRQARREYIQRQPPKKQKKAKGAKKSTKKSLLSDLANMTDEQKQELLNSLL